MAKRKPKIKIKPDPKEVLIYCDKTFTSDGAFIDLYRVQNTQITQKPKYKLVINCDGWQKEIYAHREGTDLILNGEMDSRFITIVNNVAKDIVAEME